MLRRILASLMLVGVACMASPVQASVTYQYVTDQTNYTAAAAGATVTVNLYLQETLTSGSTSLITSDGGLFGAGVAIQQAGTVPASATTISSLATNQAAIGVGGGFGTNSSTFDRTDTATQASGINSGGLIESVAIGTANAPTPDATGRILLGTATLTAGAAGTTTTFTISSFANSTDPLAVQFGEGNTVTRLSGFDLDSDNNSFNGGVPPATYAGANDILNTFTVTVAAVPEPSSVLLCGLPACGMALGLGYAGYRRRRAQLLKAMAA